MKFSFFLKIKVTQLSNFPHCPNISLLYYLHSTFIHLFFFVYFTFTKMVLQTYESEFFRPLFEIIIIWNILNCKFKTANENERMFQPLNKLTRMRVTHWTKNFIYLLLNDEIKFIIHLRRCSCLKFEWIFLAELILEVEELCCQRK